MNGLNISEKQYEKTSENSYETIFCLIPNEIKVYLDTQMYCLRTGNIDRESIGWMAKSLPSLLFCKFEMLLMSSK
jgi:hypothetical protein